MNRLNLADTRDRNLPRMLQLQAATIGNKAFLRRGEQRITFHEAERATNALAWGLKSLGVGAGDRVAFYLRSDLEAILLTLAVNKLRAIWVPINTDYKALWLEDALNRSKPAVIVADTEMLPRLVEVIDRIDCRRIVIHDPGGLDASLLDPATSPLGPATSRLGGATTWNALLEFPETSHDLAGIHYGDTAAILWTSGTTGKSKGVMQSHNTWVRSAEAGRESFESREGDVTYNVLPLYNTAAWSTNIFRGLYEGICIALDAEFSVSRFWDRIRFYGATQTFTLGAMHIFLWQAPPRPDDADNPLRAAAMVPMPEHLIEPFRERFGIELISQGFGQSETCGIFQRVSGRGKRWKANALGEPAPDGFDVKLLDDGGEEVAQGDVGEFCLKAKTPFSLFNGYFDDPEASRAAYHGEWYRTGDLGRRDQDGDFFFVDRKKDAVRHKGRNVSTMEVEAAVRRHPSVEDVAAFGVPSGELESESELKINVVLRAGAQLGAEELARYINANAPYFFVPRYIEFVSELPYTPTKKVQKYLLRRQGLNPNTWDLTESRFRVTR